MSDQLVLDLDALEEAIPGLSSHLAQAMREAAAMCLEGQRHESGVHCDIKNFEETLATADIRWSQRLSVRITRTFGDTAYAAEVAAEGIACLTIRAMTQYVVIERAVRGDGIDFWLAIYSREIETEIVRAARLESKGIAMARGDSDIRHAVWRGLRQSQRSDASGVPVIVIASEFGRPEIYMVQR